MSLPMNEIEFSSDTAHRKQWLLKRQIQLFKFSNSLLCNMKIKEICFKSDTSERKKMFRSISFSHPAKINLGLQIYLIENYTKVGDVILDPMAGSGSLLIATTISRHCILVELEKKFVDMQKANWQKIKALGPILGYTMGKAVILQGDARNLEGLLADSCIFSPPFAGSKVERDPNNKTDKYGHYEHGGLKCDIPETKGQISNLPYGEVSAVISSPPYEDSISGKGKDESEKLIPRKSPRRKGELLRLGSSQIHTYTDKPDVICTSPPYEEGGGHGGKPTKVSIEKRQSSMGQSTENLYSSRNDNIGNFKGENYLQAMLQVYQQCHRVLRDGGLMILVVKNFIRDKKIVRLDTDTIKLCESTGFTLKERLKRKLTSQSFWRIIYQQKYPDAPKIEFEDVLIFEKKPV